MPANLYFSYINKYRVHFRIFLTVKVSASLNPNREEMPEAGFYYLPE